MFVYGQHLILAIYKMLLTQQKKQKISLNLKNLLREKMIETVPFKHNGESLPFDLDREKRKTKFNLKLIALIRRGDYLPPSIFVRLRS